jgi:predicted deacylase
VGIDLHTGSDHRTNLPQIRADLDNPATFELARAFGASVMLHAATRDGSLRQAAADHGATVLLYEGGEAWRFDETAIAVGARGVRRVLEDLDMVNPVDGAPQPLPDPIVSRRSRWVRVRRSGMVQLWVNPGDVVSKGQPVGQIHDAFGKKLSRVNATVDGVVIGLNLHPIVNQGDAVINIGQTQTEPT